ncbi:MAG: Ctr copper transporter family-domain-containing protein [Monoraphidium minutum]|nr:MAG: Ctr copper transporter family-domain-containing protein [Monoraphidium minutum]
MRWRTPAPALLSISAVGLAAFALLPASGGRGRGRTFMALHDHTAHDHAHEHGGGGGMDHGGGMMMMPMSFELTFDTILWFKSWHPTTAAGWLLSALGLAALGLAHEALASYRVALARGAPPTPGALLGYTPMPAAAGGGGGGGSGDAFAPLATRALHSSLYALNLGTGYLLMLAVMTFNVGYFFTVVISMGIGHLLFFNRPWHLTMVRLDACCETSAAHE